MRKILGFAIVAFSSAMLGPGAFAGSQSYCEMLAKDYADRRTTDVDLWQKSYRNALNDCMNQYTAVAAPKKPLQEQAAAVAPPGSITGTIAAEPENQPALEPGSPSWKEYCAAKYKSFNPDTGTYSSYTGKDRPCIVTP